MSSSVKEMIDQRASIYGDFTDNAAAAQTLKDTARTFLLKNPRFDKTAYKIGETRIEYVIVEALDEIFLKISRILTGDPLYPDNWRDIAGYAMRAEERVNKYTTSAIGGPAVPLYDGKRETMCDGPTQTMSVQDALDSISDDAIEAAKQRGVNYSPWHESHNVLRIGNIDPGALKGSWCGNCGAKYGDPEHYNIVQKWYMPCTKRGQDVRPA